MTTVKKGFYGKHRNTYMENNEDRQPSKVETTISNRQPVLQILGHGLALLLHNVSFK